MSVLRLIEYQCRETISALRVLLSIALKGGLRGLVICYRTADGKEETILTGIYKHKPSAAMHASLRMSMMQMRANGELE